MCIRDSKRHRFVKDFLTSPIGGSIGFGGSVGFHLESLPQDASFRSYHRVKIDDGTSLMLMDAPPLKENVAEFIAIANFLKKHGLNSPKIYAKEMVQGFVLMQDFGDILLKTYLEEEPSQEARLYKNAVDVLLHLHKINRYDEVATKSIGQGGGNIGGKRLKQLMPSPAIADSNALISDATVVDDGLACHEIAKYYDELELLRELEIFTEWSGHDFSATQIDEFWQFWHKTLARLSILQQKLPQVLVLRDYHAENLMFLGNDADNSDDLDNSGDANGARLSMLGLLDFQDALIGNPAYDLASLLQDARRSITKNLGEQMQAYYISQANFSTQQAEIFKECYNILALQRNLKIIGIFHRLHKRDGKSKYLALLPRVFQYFTYLPASYKQSMPNCLKTYLSLA